MPNFADEQGNLKALVQAFVIDTGEQRIIVDTCIGNEKSRTDIPNWGNLQTNFLQKLTESGYAPDDISMVLCTHLHFDHVGWNTMLVDGAWVPTFKNAQYLFAEEEYNYWLSEPQKEIADDRAGFADSVQPIVDAGLSQLISTNHQVTPEVLLMPTPGHTPAHVSIIIQSEGEEAIITGDVLHHPCQITHADWETISDTDPNQATETRKALLEKYTDTQTLIIGSHFASPTAGYLRDSDGELRLE